MNTNIKDIKNQFKLNKNSYGESQAWLEIDKNRSIEITHEKEGLPKNEEFYSLRLHCNNEEYDNDKFNKTMGIIDIYNTEKISNEQLEKGINYLMQVNKTM
jgi:hypothetical protein